MKTVVVALGGNALIKPGQQGTHEEQSANAAAMAKAVGQLVEKGYRVVIAHGNGPQVGNLAVQQVCSSDVVPPLPLHSLGAMTQGQIGSLLVQALWAALPHHRGRLVAVVTHAVVDAEDPAFDAPSKPIGPFLDAQAEASAIVRGWIVGDDAGRGRRRLVPSPSPRAILEADAISLLVDAGFLVIAGGGGGIPLARREYQLTGVEAVIDKDRTALELAKAVRADVLALITGIDHVLLDFGTPGERPIIEMTTQDAQRYIAGEQFAVGSMKPKVEAAVEFVNAGGEFALITSPACLVAAAAGEAGSRIVRSGAA